MDATPTSRLCEFVCEHLQKVAQDPKSNNASITDTPILLPKSVDFHISKRVEKIIEKAETNIDLLVS